MLLYPTKRNLKLSVSTSVLLVLCFCFGGQILAQTPNYSWFQQDNSGHYWNSGRYGHGMAYLEDDHVLLFGGMAQGRLQDTYVYDLSANTWQPRGGDPMPDNRMEFGMAHIGSGQVLLFGGNRAYGTWLDDTWLYDESQHSWTQLTPQNSPGNRRSLAMAYIGDDKVLLFGGYQGSAFGNSDETWLFDLSEGDWTLMNPASGPSRREGHAMAYIGEDKVLLFGGCLVPETQNYSDDTWVYDLSENSWTQKNPQTKPAPRQYHDMAYLQQGYVVLYGGASPGYPTPNILDETWIYTIADDSWSEYSGTPDPGARILHALSETSMQGLSKTVLFSGSVTSADTWIFSAEGIGPECSDGIDNDNDGQIDYPDDSSCTGYYDTSETYRCWRIWWPRQRREIFICLVPVVIISISILIAAGFIGWFFYRRRRKKR